MASKPPPPVHTRPIADGHLLPSSATINHHHQPAACLRRSGAGGQQEKLIQERTTRTTTSERRNCGTSKVTPFSASLNLFLPTTPSSSQTREYAFARSLSSKQSFPWNFNGQESLDVRHSGAALTDYCHATATLYWSSVISSSLVRSCLNCRPPSLGRVHWDAQSLPCKICQKVTLTVNRYLPSICFHGLLLLCLYSNILSVFRFQKRHILQLSCSPHYSHIMCY